MIVTPVPSDMIEVLWPQILPLVLPAIEKSKGEISPEGMRTRLIEDDERLIGVLDETTFIACFTLRIIDFETGVRKLNVIACGGTLLSEWWEEGWDLVKQTAKAVGCNAIQVIGRPGWERKIPDLHKCYTVLEAEV